MKKFKHTRVDRNYPVNFVLNNVVDDDVQSLLLPLNLTQYLMFCPKYRIKNDLISPNSWITYFISILATLLFILLFLYRNYMLYFFIDFMGRNNFTYFISYFDCIFYCVGFTMNVIVGIIQTQKFIKFVLTFQKVHRFLNNETCTRRYIIWNWIIVIIFICTYSAVFPTFSLVINSPLLHILVTFFFIFFDFNVIYAIRLFKLLEDKVVLWNVQALNALEREDMHRGNYIEQMFETFVDILECYDIQQVCSQQFILYYMVEAFVHSLIYIQVTIEILKAAVSINNLSAASIASLSLYCWMIKDLIWQAILSMQCEKFYLAIQDVQDTCTVILKSNCSDSEKQLCKNIIRLQQTSFSKIRVCGLFYIDASLQLNILSYFTSYTIVLLQFAFV